MNKLYKQILMEKKESSKVFQYPKQDSNFLKPINSLDNNVHHKDPQKKQK